MVGLDCDSGTASNDPMTMNETRAHQLIRAQRTSAEGLQPRVLLDEDAIRWPEGRESRRSQVRVLLGPPLSIANPCARGSTWTYRATVLTIPNLMRLSAVATNRVLA